MSSRQSRHGGRLAKQSGQPKVSDLDSAAFVDEDILRLDVAMDHAFVMCKLQCVAQLPDDGERFLGSQFLDRFRSLSLSQSDSVDEFHQQKIDAAALSEFVHDDDMRMTERCQQPSFSQESFGESRVRGHLTGQNFQRGDAIEFLLTNFEDSSHAADAEQLLDLQMRKRGGELFDLRRPQATRGPPP